MREINNIDDLIGEVGIEKTNNLMTEYFLFLRGKSDVFDKVKNELSKNKPDIDRIRSIVDGDIYDDIME